MHVPQNLCPVSRQHHQLRSTGRYLVFGALGGCRFEELGMCVFSGALAAHRPFKAVLKLMVSIVFACCSATSTEVDEM